MTPIHGFDGERLRALFPAGTVLHNPVSGEYARVVENSVERGVGDLLVTPGGAVPGAHVHPRQSEAFEVVAGTLGYRRGEETGVLGPGERLEVPPGVVHDWWNAGKDTLQARVTVTPPGSFLAMIGAVWGLGVTGRTNAKGMPRLPEAALMAEAFGGEIVFTKPPPAVQRALAATVAPLVRRRGRTVTSEALITAAIIPADRWPEHAPQPAAV